MLERRRSHHAHARHVAVREPKAHHEQHEEHVGADDRPAGRFARAPLDVAHKEDRDEECAEEGEGEKAAGGPDVESGEGQDGTTNDVAGVEHEEVDRTEYEWMDRWVC